MWGRELGVSSYRWPLLLVLCCLREGKREQEGTGETQLRCGQKGSKIRSSRSHFSGNGRPDKPSTILSSSAATGYLATPSCCLQVASSWQQGWVGGGCCCCWPPAVTAIYCATLSSTVLKHDPYPLVNTGGHSNRRRLCAGGGTCLRRGEWGYNTDVWPVCGLVLIADSRSTK